MYPKVLIAVPECIVNVAIECMYVGQARSLTRLYIVISNNILSVYEYSVYYYMYSCSFHVGYVML